MDNKHSQSILTTHRPNLIHIPLTITHPQTTEYTVRCMLISVVLHAQDCTDSITSLTHSSSQKHGSSTRILDILLPIGYSFHCVVCTYMEGGLNVVLIPHPRQESKTQLHGAPDKPLPTLELRPPSSITSKGLQGRTRISLINSSCHLIHPTHPQFPLR